MLCAARHKCNAQRTTCAMRSAGVRLRQKEFTMTQLRATSSYEQTMMTAHVQCSRAPTHQSQPLSPTFPWPTPPQPQKTHENAQDMCHDRCFSMFSRLLTQPLRAEPLQANCALMPAQPHSPELQRTENCPHCSGLPTQHENHQKLTRH